MQYNGILDYKGLLSGKEEKKQKRKEQDRKSTRSAYESYRLTYRQTGLILEVLADLKRKSCVHYCQAVEILMTNSVQFCVRVALFKHNFVQDARS